MGSWPLSMMSYGGIWCYPSRNRMIVRQKCGELGISRNGMIDRFLRMEYQVSMLKEQNLQMKETEETIRERQKGESLNGIE